MPKCQTQMKRKTPSKIETSTCPALHANAFISGIKRGMSIAANELLADA